MQTDDVRATHIHDNRADKYKKIETRTCTAASTLNLSGVHGECSRVTRQTGSSPDSRSDNTRSIITRIALVTGDGIIRTTISSAVTGHANILSLVDFIVT